MAEHFCRAESRFLPGQGTRHRTTCTPCKWTSQWHRTRTEADADYRAHTTPKAAFYEPTDRELLNYGLPIEHATGLGYGFKVKARGLDGK